MTHTTTGRLTTTIGDAPKGEIQILEGGWVYVPSRDRYYSPLVCEEIRPTTD